MHGSVHVHAPCWLGPKQRGFLYVHECVRMEGTWPPWCSHSPPGYQGLVSVWRMFVLVWCYVCCMSWLFVVLGVFSVVLAVFPLLPAVWGASWASGSSLLSFFYNTSSLFLDTLFQWCMGLEFDVRIWWPFTIVSYLIVWTVCFLLLRPLHVFCRLTGRASSLLGPLRLVVSVMNSICCEKSRERQDIHSAAWCREYCPEDRKAHAACSSGPVCWILLLRICVVPLFPPIH